MNFSSILGDLKSSPDYEGQIVHIRTISGRPPQFKGLKPPLPPPLLDACKNIGIEELYTHQVDAIARVRRGSDIVVVTASASGKSLCYNLPVMEAVLDNPGTKAFYIFPTKALARDQLRALNQMSTVSPCLKELMAADAYDGDTPQHHRRAIRTNCNIVFTNPDMLHQGILPSHPKWAGFFRDLRFVVLDEVHSYRGVFGSNVANLLRRLNRICRHYGSRPQYLCSSATIANPKELAERLLGREVEIIDQDGSPRGTKHFILWNPPFSDRFQMMRKSPSREAQKILIKLVRQGVQTIVFTLSRTGVELIYRHVKESLGSRTPALAKKIRAYRGGYLPSERRAIEQELFAGELLAVVCTNALELGVDIGELDACMIVGYPGTIASTWQQAGRAGRTREDSLVIFIPFDMPVDQYLARYPEYLFEKSPENAIIDPENPYVLLNHLECGAWELPLRADDEVFFGPLFREIVALLEDCQEVKRIRDRWYWANPEFPARRVGLRTISTDTYDIVCEASGGERKIIGSIDSSAAAMLVHPGAVYLHEGETYLVKSLDRDAKIATIERRHLDYFTRPTVSSTLRVIKEGEKKSAFGTEAGFGEVEVTRRVASFHKQKFFTLEKIGTLPLELPPDTLSTCAAWLKLPEELSEACRENGLSFDLGLIGIRNMISTVLPLLVMCDKNDMGVVADTMNFGRPTLFVYDNFTGGLGFAERAYSVLQDALAMCLQLVKECSCKEGCPGCVGLYNRWRGEDLPHGRQDGEGAPSKEAAVFILAELLRKGAT